MRSRAGSRKRTIRIPRISLTSDVSGPKRAASSESLGSVEIIRGQRCTDGAVPRPAVVPCQSIRLVAKSGEIPAQSRYGERPSKSASPVAGHTVHARTFERKVGRTRAQFRIDPSFDPVRSEGFRVSARPLRRPLNRLGGLHPCPQPRLPDSPPRRPVRGPAPRPRRLLRRHLLTDSDSLAGRGSPDRHALHRAPPPSRQPARPPPRPSR